VFSRHIFLFSCLVFAFFSLSAQDKKSGPKEKTFKPDLKSNKQLRKEAREKKRIERAEKKAIRKHHHRIQTKQVRKRMKSSRKAATRHNEHRREFFIKRWLKKRR
jgi:hypothetical protein